MATNTLQPLTDALGLVSRAEAHLRRHAKVGLRDGLLLASVGDRPVRVGALARDAAVRVPTASHILDRLETAGLVVRTMASDDRRAVEVQLTDAGRRARDEVRTVLADLLPEQ